jgi:S-adenosylmethionine:diacylglycerol 3-amino-3-carboxypropyl transferase
LERAELVYADAATFLREAAPGSIHFFALSNIVDGLAPTQARRLLTAVARAAAPGAVACLRFLLPPPDDWDAWLPDTLRVDAEMSDRLERQDRSLFCRFIRVLRRVEGGYE